MSAIAGPLVQQRIEDAGGARQTSGQQSAQFAGRQRTGRWPRNPLRREKRKSIGPTAAGLDALDSSDG
jgi:hypothetical protein